MSSSTYFFFCFLIKVILKLMIEIRKIRFSERTEEKKWEEETEGS